MKIKLVSTLVLFFYMSISFAQSNLDAYKYIIIPEKYDFLRSDDQYRLNSLTKFLFEKYGFNTLLENEDYPVDLRNNPCLALNAEVINNSTMFTTKLVVELSDCYKKVIFTSDEGRSKEKLYEKSYQEALRKTFVTFEEMTYNFNEDLVVNKQISKKEPTANNTSKSESNTPVQEVAPAVIVATPEAAEQIEVKKAEEPKDDSLAKSYKNENISFFLIEQNNSLVAYVKKSTIEAYQMGEKIGTLYKTSRANTYRITWKDVAGNSRETTGYFDEAGNLKIDIEKDGKIQVITFNVE